MELTDYYLLPVYMATAYGFAQTIRYTPANLAAAFTLPIEVAGLGLSITGIILTAKDGLERLL
ncbi:hypothetical protein HOD38_02475 [archaeon]|jgi:hypothetical protein|nr:hypothetical protein [archaeon]MBT4397108.1 hypothetical protein [archaeon]MBT4441165.1 hypothetical protein [archaeon]